MLDAVACTSTRNTFVSPEFLTSRSVLLLESKINALSAYSKRVALPPARYRRLLAVPPLFLKYMLWLLLRVMVPDVVIAPEEMVPMLSRFLVEPCIT